MRYYVVIADNAEDYLIELIPCEKCKYFMHLKGDKVIKPYICRHPDAMVVPSPNAWCSYGKRKDHD